MPTNRLFSLIKKSGNIYDLQNEPDDIFKVKEMKWVGSKDNV